MFTEFRKTSAPRLEFAPLLDIIFILLIFFAVSTTLISNQSGLKLTLPEATSSKTEKKGLIVSITKKKQIIINKKTMSYAHLEQYIQNEIKKDPELKVILNAEASLPYRTIIRTLDHIRLGGCYNIILQAKLKKA